MEKFNFNAEKIDKVEKKLGKSSIELADKYNLSSLSCLLQEGWDLGKEKVYERIDEWRKKKDVIYLWLEVMEQLKKDGFLHPALVIEERKKLLEDMGKSLAKTGKKGKKSQSK